MIDEVNYFKMIPTLGVIMDPIQTINFAKDSSFGLLLEAQKQRWPLFYMEDKHLVFNNEGPSAYMRSLHVFNNIKHWFTLGAPQVKKLSELSVILMRQDPPVDRAYFHTTQILQKACEQGVCVVNHPQSLRDCNEKLLILEFPNYCPPTCVTQSYEEGLQFLEQHQDIIIKPLDGMGGQSIFRVHHKDFNKRVIFETLIAREEKYFMLQRYIPEILKGDKRIIMIDGQPVEKVLARIPASEETRANLAVGGTGIARSLSERDLEICHAVGPYLQKKGLLWVGLDVIGDYLTEINITSPTCIRELEQQSSLNINQQLLTCFKKKITTTLK